MKTDLAIPPPLYASTQSRSAKAAGAKFRVRSRKVETAAPGALLEEVL